MVTPQTTLPAMSVGSLVCLMMLSLAAAASGQTPAVEKLGPSQFRIGQVRVDTAKHELRANATLNDVLTIEFAANTKNGLKAYEGALTIDSDAITFNAALLLMGLDPSHGRPSKFQFDPATPEGDPVSLEIAFGNQRVPLEELLFDSRAKQTLRAGPWVYTGSTFFDNGQGQGRQFIAEVDGVILGLMHGPAALIENPRNDAVTGYGSFVINPRLGLAPGAQVTLIVTALKK